MFTRMKQNLREKTGQATGTKFSQKLETEMNYYLEWDKRDKAIVKAVQEVIETFKNCQKRNQMVDTLHEIERAADGGPVAEGAANLHKFLEARTVAEKETFEKVTGLFKARCDTFASAELKSVVDAVKALKKKRLTRDGTEADYQKKQTEDKKAKFETADNEFKIALKQVEDYGARIEEWDTQHKNNFIEALQAISIAFNNPE